MTPTAPSPRSGERRRRPAATDQAPLRGAARRGRRVGETPVKQKPSPMPRATGGRITPTSADQALVREVVRMQRDATQALSHAEVIRRLQEAGRRVTKADLRRAMYATNTQWGRATKKTKGTQPRPVRSDNTKPRPPIVGQSPRPRVVEAVRHLRTAQPSLSAGEMTHRLRSNGLRVVEAEVVAAIEAVQLRGRRKARPTAPDRALAREASLLSARSTRTLSLDEVVKQLRAAGWRVTAADLDYALAVTNTKLGEPSSVPKQSGAIRRPASRGLPWGDAEVSDPNVCQACGVPVSANGYCGCS